MGVDARRVEEFGHEGFVFLPSFVSIEIINAVLERVQEDPYVVVQENDGSTPRSLHVRFDPHSVLGRVAALDSLVDLASSFLKDQVYVYQLKINMKSAFDGEQWPWHRDYEFWSVEDGMRSPQVLTVAVFLEEVTDFNGPIHLIPRSHKVGLHVHPRGREEGRWEDCVSANLPYQTPRAEVTEQCRANGISAPKGPAGSALVFDGNIIHASPGNISPNSRKIVFITYNAMSNLVEGSHRPEFLVNVAAKALKPMLWRNDQRLDLIKQK